MGTPDWSKAMNSGLHQIQPDKKVVNRTFKSGESGTYINVIHYPRIWKYSE